MASTHAQHIEDLHFRVLKLLQDKPDLSQRDLARQLGISHGKMNYCMTALIDKGLIKLENFQHSQHKFKYAYLLTPAGIAEKAALTGRFLKRKMAEYEALRLEIEDLCREEAALHMHSHPAAAQAQALLPSPLNAAQAQVLLPSPLEGEGRG